MATQTKKLFQGPIAEPGPVECLGETFPDEQARRTHFLKILTEKLKDPGFRKIEGFPIGTDEDILALSDPPYYTACPNPFIADFIECYGTPYDPKAPYSKEPFAADVSEGKNHPIYNVHSYHTKVPHKAIMRYILHYTQPGDVVFDGFCGTGMTGVAAQLCGDRTAVTELGYRVDKHGNVLAKGNDGEPDAWSNFSKIGARRSVLNDLSPFAAFVASRYNDFCPDDYDSPSRLDDVLGVSDAARPLYLSRGSENKSAGDFEFYVWSEVFSCPSCQYECSLFELAVDKVSLELRDEFNCSNCGKSLGKDDLTTVWTSTIDLDGRSLLKERKTLPVEISASLSGSARRFSPKMFDLELLKSIESMPLTGLTT